MIDYENTCQAENCEKIMVRAKYCNKHKLRYLRHGDPNIRTKVAKGEYKGVMCAAKDCDRDAQVKNLCKMHYTKNLRLKNKGLNYD